VTEVEGRTTNSKKKEDSPPASQKALLSLYDKGRILKQGVGSWGEGKKTKSKILLHNGRQKNRQKTAPHKETNAKKKKNNGME